MMMMISFPLQCNATFPIIVSLHGLSWVGDILIKLSILLVQNHCTRCVYIIIIIRPLVLHAALSSLLSSLLWWLLYLNLIPIFRIVHFITLFCYNQGYVYRYNLFGRSLRAGSGSKPHRLSESMQHHLWPASPLLHVGCRKYWRWSVCEGSWAWSNFDDWKERIINN